MRVLEAAFVVLAVSLCVAAHHQELATFSPATGAVTNTVEISGIDHDEEIIGLDYRPANGLLYLISDAGRIYTITTATGAATLVSTAKCTLDGSKFGIDFNPSDSGANYRIEVTSGNCTIDGDVSYVVGDAHNGVDPKITAVAYLNNFAGATTTTLYAVDNGVRSLASINPPNNGSLSTIGNLTPLLPADQVVGFDIVTPTAPTSNVSISYVLANNGTGANLYSVDILTGALSNRRTVGTRNDYVGLALSINGAQAVTFYTESISAAVVPMLVFVLLAVVSLVV